MIRKYVFPVTAIWTEQSHLGTQETHLVSVFLRRARYRGSATVRHMLQDVGATTVLQVC